VLSNLFLPAAQYAV